MDGKCPPGFCVSSCHQRSVESGPSLVERHLARQMSQTVHFAAATAANPATCNRRYQTCPIQAQNHRYQFVHNRSRFSHRLVSPKSRTGTFAESCSLRIPILHCNTCMSSKTVNSTRTLSKISCRASLHVFLDSVQIGVHVDCCCCTCRKELYFVLVVKTRQIHEE